MCFLRDCPAEEISITVLALVELFARVNETHRTVIDLNLTAEIASLHDTAGLIRW